MSDRAAPEGGADRDPPLRLAVVGGGFTGAVLAVHLVRSTTRALDVAMVEPRAELGRGVAYSTPDPSHRINVPSDRMSVDPADGAEATRWLFDHGVLPDRGSDDGQGLFYVPRHAYGAFVGDLLRRTLAAAGGRVSFRHLRTRATALTGEDGRWRVALEAAGSPLAADAVALCFGHAVPHLPFPLADAVGAHPKFVRDPWAEAALDAVGPDDAVLVAGTGLTMADIVASLRARGHRGPITAVSRRGLLPRPHGVFASDINFLAGAAPPATALALLRLVRRRVRDAGPDLGWQPIADALRPQLPTIWGALPTREKHRVLRWLLPFWDVHRFRVAPQVHDVIRRDRDAGSLTVERGALRGLAREGGRFLATLRLPGGRDERRAVDAVVLCTGPDKDLRGNPLVASLLAGGLARLDATGLGLAVDRDSRVLAATGAPWRTLLAFGPMTRGSFGEMTGAPDITRHIHKLAPGLAARLGLQARETNTDGG